MKKIKDVKIIYTAIPKFLVYANMEIGAYVENKGHAVVTPWQYEYGMGGTVDYEDLKNSLNNLALNSDEVWFFGAPKDTFPNHEHTTKHGLGITDGCWREIKLARGENIKVVYHEFDPETMDITRIASVQKGGVEE